MGSVVGRPSASSTAPAGSARPSRAATRTLPMAMALVAKSTTVAGRSSPPGKAMHRGFVERRVSMPRCGATGGSWSTALTKAIVTMPAATACSP